MPLTTYRCCGVATLLSGRRSMATQQPPPPQYADTAKGFVGLRREGWFWRDNTKALAEMILSNNSQVVFTRPPRFGKTTFFAK